MVFSVCIRCSFVFLLLWTRNSESVQQCNVLKPPVHSVNRGAGNVERLFICEALSCDRVGMNSGLVTVYIELVAPDCLPHWSARSLLLLMVKSS